MKLSLFLMLIATFQLYAGSTYSQTVSLSFSYKNTPIEKIMDQIENETEFSFLILDKQIDTKKAVSVDAKKNSVEQILDNIFKNTNIEYRIVDRQIILMEKASSLGINQNNNKKITGTITDEKGDPIIGANVMEKGTTNGTITDIDGNFSISVSENTILQFTYIGYVDQEVKIGNRNTFHIKLVEDSKTLDEVVIIGYGTVKKSDLTGAVSSVKTTEIQQTPMVSIDQGLVGRASGVQVTQTSGMPGATASIRVRGSSSLQGGNEPLYVIDGFPVYSGGGFGNTGGKTSLSGLSTVNPSDIESIEILKDAAATAIYGARAANGVVLITTKSGKKGFDNISFETNFGFSNVSKKLDLMNAQEYAALVNEAYTNDGLKPYYSSDELTGIAQLGNGTDWQDEIFRTGVSQNYQLSFSGGDDRSQYAISGNYFKQDGIIISSDFERYSLRLNFDRHITKNFTVGTHLSASYTINNSVATETGGEDGVVSGVQRMNPVQPIYSDELTGAYTQVNTPGILIPNPVATAKERKFNNTASRLLGDIYMQWEIIKDLTFKVSLGTDVMYHKTNRYTPSTIYQSNGIARADIGVNKTINWLNENTVNWNTTIGEDHSLSLLGGFTLQQNNTEHVLASSSKYVNDVMKYNNLGAGSVFNAPSSNAPQWNLLSYLARVNYDWKHRYLFSANARVDGSSRFGANNKYGFFPSASAAWRISEEPFMEATKDILSNLKLRTSYGITGNTEIEAYSSLATLESNNWVIGNQLVTGFFPNKIPNPDLKWEKTGQFDIGLDVGFFDNRLRLTADYYYKKTTDLIYSVAITGVSGYQTMLKNIGSMENKGYEISIESDNIRGPFVWNIWAIIPSLHKKANAKSA